MAFSSVGTAFLSVGRVGFAALLLAAAASGVACSSDDGRQGVRGDGQNGGGNGSGSGSGLGDGSGGGIDLGDDDGGTGAGNLGCNELQVTFGQVIPNVAILVDRSLSMWDFKVPNTQPQVSFWDALKPAVLNVVDAFQDEVKFSMSAYSSPERSGPARGDTCPIYVESSAPALNNGPSIHEAYEQASVVDMNVNETPTVYALEDAMLMLEGLGADAGPKHILLVTDGQPDYCESEREACAVYETIGIIQKAYGRGIGTIVVGLVNGDNPALETNLQHFANAGAGMPVEDAQIEQNGNNPSHCWTPTYGTATAAHPAQFGTATTNAPVHIPDQDSSSLEAALAGIIKNVKSCSYELEGQVKINPDTAHLGKIYLQQGDNEIEVTFDEQGGWFLTDGTQVELAGDSCTTLKSAETTGIRFDFPCEVFVR